MTPDDFKDRFKEGDILRIRNWILVFAQLGIDNWIDHHPIVYHVLWNIEHVTTLYTVTSTGIGYVESIKNQDVRFATNNEIKQFYHALEAKGLTWDRESMSVVSTTPVATVDSITGEFVT